MSTTRVNQDWVSGFTADTPILMADGTLKPIKDIKPGDMVASFDHRKGQSAVSVVSETFVDIYDDSLEVNVDGRKMIVAASQHFFTPEMEFKSAVETNMVVTMEGDKAISFKRFKGGKIRFYDITVEDTHTFIANGLLVHNKKAGGGGKSVNTKATNNSNGATGPAKNSGKVTQTKTSTQKTNNNNKTSNQDSSKGGKGGKNNDKKNKGNNKGKGIINVKNNIDVEVEVNIDLGDLLTEGEADILIDVGFGGDDEEVKKAGNPVPTKVIKGLQDAQDQRSAVCKALGTMKNEPNKATLTKHKDTINDVIKLVKKAQSDDPGIGQGNGGTSRNVEYKAILDDLIELRTFINKNKKFPAKKKQFIDGKCSEIQDGIQKVVKELKAIKNEDTTPGGGGGITVRPLPIVPIKPVKKVVIEDESSGRDRVYSNSPDYDYFSQLANRDATGCTGYVFEVPNTQRPFIGNQNPAEYNSGYTKADVYYKHFDATKGKFYYSKSSINCL